MILFLILIFLAVLIAGKIITGLIASVAFWLLVLTFAGYVVISIIRTPGKYKALRQLGAAIKEGWSKAGLLQKVTIIVGSIILVAIVLIPYIYDWFIV